MNKLTFEEFSLLDTVIWEYIFSTKEFIHQFENTAVKDLIILRKDMESKVEKLENIREKLKTVELCEVLND